MSDINSRIGQEDSDMVNIVGLDIEQSLFSAVGSASEKFSVTCKSDIGRALAELSILCMSSANASEVPDHIRIAGDSISFEELRDLVQKRTGREIELRAEDLVQYKLQLKETTIKEGERRPAHWIRYASFNVFWYRLLVQSKLSSN